MPSSNLGSMDLKKLLDGAMKRYGETGVQEIINNPAVTTDILMQKLGPQIATENSVQPSDAQVPAANNGTPPTVASGGFSLEDPSTINLLANLGMSFSKDGSTGQKLGAWAGNVAQGQMYTNLLQKLLGGSNF